MPHVLCVAEHFFPTQQQEVTRLLRDCHVTCMTCAAHLSRKERETFLFQISMADYVLNASMELDRHMSAYGFWPEHYVFVPSFEEASIRNAARRLGLF